MAESSADIPESGTFAGQDARSVDLPPTGSTGDERAFDAGWLMCARWANRDDLNSDMDSPAYQAQRAQHLEVLRSSAAGEEPDPALLISMAVCLNHGFGLLSPQAQASLLSGMRKVWDEMAGRGYFRPSNRERYLALVNEEDPVAQLLQAHGLSSSACTGPQACADLREPAATAGAGMTSAIAGMGRESAS